MVFVGATRFSLFQPNSAAWRTSQAGRFNSPDEYRKFLFSDDRLAPRMKILGEISMPLISKAAEHHKIRHIIQYSPELPQKYQARLQDLAAAYPFIVLSDISDKSGATHPYTVADALTNGSGPYALYRLDDDDFLSPDYFDQTSRYVSEEFLGFRVSLAAGATGIYNGQHFETLRYVHRPNIAIGLASIQGRNKAGDFIAPPASSHHHSDRVGPVIVDAQKCAYFWTRHEGQDTDVGRNNPFDTVRTEVSRLMPIPEDWDMAALFPSLDGYITKRTATDLGTNISIPMEGFEIPCTLKGSVSLQIDATFPDGMTATSTLVSVRFKDQEHALAHPEQYQGLVASPAPHIGMFRYLISYPGRRSSEIEFEIPESAEVTSLKFMPFGADARPFTVNSVKSLQTVES